MPKTIDQLVEDINASLSLLATFADQRPGEEISARYAGEGVYHVEWVDAQLEIPQLAILNLAQLALWDETLLRRIIWFIFSDDAGEETEGFSPDLAM